MAEPNMSKKWSFYTNTVDVKNLKFMEIGAKLVISVSIASKVTPMYGAVVVLM